MINFLFSILAICDTHNCIAYPQAKVPTLVVCTTRDERAALGQRTGQHAMLFETKDHTGAVVFITIFDNCPQA